MVFGQRRPVHSLAEAGDGTRFEIHSFSIRGDVLRALLSAYACEPHKGSEQEVGWQRAVQMLDFADEVWVITRANSREVIEAESISRHPKLHFLYYDLPGWAAKLKKQFWFFPVYVMLWQRGAYRMAAKQHGETPFDAVYHVTFTGMIHGSHMGRLGIPLIIGPIAGGERAPFALRRGLPLRYRLQELFRDATIVAQPYNPLTYPAMKSARRIYISTADSFRLIPPGMRSKTEVLLSIATPPPEQIAAARRPSPVPRFMFAGRHLYWKGVHLAIRALAEAKRVVPSATLTLYGRGPADAWLHEVVRKAGVEDAVDFAGFAPRRQFLDSFRTFTALVFPSLHDSGGLIALEALARGLPVLCLDLGGPGMLVNETCGAKVSVSNLTEPEAVSGLAQAMARLAIMAPEEMEQLSQGALRRAAELSWRNLTERVMRMEGP